MAIGKNSEIASVGSTVEIGNNVHIGDYNMIISRDGITIGDGTIFGPHVYVYDHDHEVKEGKVCRNSYSTMPVKIGSNSWIGTNTVILKGTSIGKDCIIAAGSVVSGDIPDGTTFYQKRENRIKDR